MLPCRWHAHAQSIAKARNKLKVDGKCKRARRKVSTGDSDEKVAAWFSQISGKHICRTVESMQCVLDSFTNQRKNRCIGGVCPNVATTR